MNTVLFIDNVVNLVTYYLQHGAAAVEEVLPKPKSMTRPKHWSVEVEEAYRFQTAGYKDKNEYVAMSGAPDVSLE